MTGEEEFSFALVGVVLMGRKLVRVVYWRKVYVGNEGVGMPERVYR